jgi:hypothetical protein
MSKRVPAGIQQAADFAIHHSVDGGRFADIPEY